MCIVMPGRNHLTKLPKEMDALRSHLAKNNLKLTRHRELILVEFLKKEHITAEQMYHELARKDPHPGLATIYRTLPLLRRRAGPGPALRLANPVRQRLAQGAS